MAMPSHVRIFFWIIVLVVAYWVASAAWVLAFPPSQFSAALTKLTPEARGIIRADMLVPLAVRCVAFLLLAWLAAFRDQNWARWGIAFLSLWITAVPAVFALTTHTFDRYLQDHLLDPGFLIVTALLVAAIVFVFTGNARLRFRAPLVV
jgi:hypothetical protein